MSEISKKNCKEVGCSVIRRNWEQYSSQGQLYEYTDTNYRQPGDISYLDEYYRKSSESNIGIDAILNTFVQRGINDDPNFWDPVLQ